jgi:hypothetical protein
MKMDLDRRIECDRRHGAEVFSTSGKRRKNFWLREEGVQRPPAERLH